MVWMCPCRGEASVSDVYSGGILDSGPPIREDFRTASVEATIGSKKRVSPQCPIC